MVGEDSYFIMRNKDCAKTSGRRNAKAIKCVSSLKQTNSNNDAGADKRAGRSKKLRTDATKTRKDQKAISNNSKSDAT